jgi:hypothetical protein
MNYSTSVTTAKRKRVASDDEIEINENDLNIIQQSMKWSDMWRLLRSNGWNWSFKSRFENDDNHSMDYYFSPGVDCLCKSAPYFDGETAVRVHLLQNKAYFRSLLTTTTPTDDSTEFLPTNKEITIYSSLAFSSDDSVEFVALNECPLRKDSGNLTILPMLCNIAIDYGHNTEIRRKELYSKFMLEIKNMLSNELIILTYEDWSNCFNTIFTSILIGKLQQCSSYMRNKEVVPVGFRFRTKINTADALQITNYYEAVKKTTIVDVKDIMKILHLVLRDSCCSEHNNITNEFQLICREDYSSLYLESSLEQNFHGYVTAQISVANSGLTTTGASFHQLLSATAPEAILLDTSHKKYQASQVTVISNVYLLLYFVFSYYFLLIS